MRTLESRESGVSARFAHANTTARARICRPCQKAAPPPKAGVQSVRGSNRNLGSRAPAGQQRAKREQAGRAACCCSAPSTKGARKQALARYGGSCTVLVAQQRSAACNGCPGVKCGMQARSNAAQLRHEAQAGASPGACKHRAPAVQRLSSSPHAVRMRCRLQLRVRLLHCARQGAQRSASSPLGSKRICGGLVCAAIVRILGVLPHAKHGRHAQRRSCGRHGEGEAGRRRRRGQRVAQRRGQRRHVLLQRRFVFARRAVLHTAPLRVERGKRSASQGPRRRSLRRALGRRQGQRQLRLVQPCVGGILHRSALRRVPR